MVKMGVVKLTSCSGCINEVLYSLALEPKLAEAYDVRYFIELGKESENEEFDILFIEGSISTREQEEYVKVLRSRARFLVALGTCSIMGGIQSLWAEEDLNIVKKAVYVNPDYIEVLNEIKPLDDIVSLDLIVPGCPVNRLAVVSLLKKFALGGLPIVLWESVCGDCKRGGILCVSVSKGVPCLGPITLGGCRALCPSFGRGCYGCYGLRWYDLDKHKVDKFIEVVKQLDLDEKSILTFLKGFGFKAYREIHRQG